METHAEDAGAALRQDLQGFLFSGSDGNEGSFLFPGKGIVELAGSSQSSSRGHTPDNSGAAPAASPEIDPATITAANTSSPTSTRCCDAALGASSTPRSARPPSSLHVVSISAVRSMAEKTNTDAAFDAPADLSEDAAPALSSGSPAAAAATAVPPRSAQKMEAEQKLTPAKADDKGKKAMHATTFSHRKHERASAQCDLAHRTIPSKRKAKAAINIASQINELLTGAAGTPSKLGSPDKTQKTMTPNTLTPIHRLDLPLGLLVLYYAAEDTCTATESVAAPSPASAHSTASYSLLYILEQLSDLRSRDHRRAAVQRANAIEEAKCKELFEAAAKRRSANAAQQAARAQEVAEAELAQCTFHPDVSPAAQDIAVKGTKDFVTRCLEWREEAHRRLRQKYERQAALHGVGSPGEFMTKQSRRLLEDPAAQERLKARPSLWVAKKPASDAAADDPRSPAAGLLGAPVGSKVVEEQEAILQSLRHTPAGERESPLRPTSDSRCEEGRKSSTVRQFLRRVEEDAQKRELNAARLQSRYHNPEMERFEAGTGQRFFTPNAMPTVWKDGRRVGYEDLTKDEQRDFRAELRKAGLDFVLTRHCRNLKGRLGLQGGGEGAEGEDGEAGPKGGEVNIHTRDTSAHLQGGVLTTAQQERFLASLKDALKRREEKLALVREQATVEETFHPHITPRSIKMAQHKIGRKPIYERSTIERDTAAASPKSAPNTADTESSTSLYNAHRGRPLPEAAEVFLARNVQWMEARQRRLERLAAMEEEKRYGECTFTPNRTFFEPGDAQMQPGRAPEQAGLFDSSYEGSEQGSRHHKSKHERQQDEMATAADVRLMNELELLRSGAAFRDERFVQAVCERTGVSDPRQAMANLSLQSAPRLASSRAGATPASRCATVSASVRSSSQQISPISKRLIGPSASPYTVPSRLDPRQETSPSSTYESQPSVRMMRSESGATQTPTHRQSHMVDIRRSPPSPLQPPPMSRAIAHREFDELPPVEDPWAALDAQTDAILKRHGY